MYNLISCSNQFFKNCIMLLQCSFQWHPTTNPTPTTSLLGNTGEITDFHLYKFAPRVFQIKGNLRSQLAKGLIVQEADPQETKWTTHDTVDGRNLAAVEVGSLSHYLQGFNTIPGGWPWEFWTINSSNCKEVKPAALFEFKRKWWNNSCLPSHHVGGRSCWQGYCWPYRPHRPVSNFRTLCPFCLASRGVVTTKLYACDSVEKEKLAKNYQKVDTPTNNGEQTLVSRLKVFFVFSLWSNILEMHPRLWYAQGQIQTSILLDASSDG